MNVMIRAGRPLVLKVKAKGRPTPAMSFKKEPYGEDLVTRAYTDCNDGKHQIGIQCCMFDV